MARRCETRKLYEKQATGLMAPKFRKFEFFEHIEVGEGFGHQNSRVFFAGANFIASRHRGSYFKCLVEWLHRREIPRQGQSPNRMPMRRWFVFDVLERSAFLKTLDFDNCQDRSIPIGYGLILSRSHASPLRNKKVIVTHATGGMAPKFRKFENFQNIDAGEGLGHQN